MAIISTKRYHENWAKKKAKELGEIDSVHLGETHANFIREKKSGEISAVQLRYPASILGFIREWTAKGLVILFYGILGAGIGFLLGSFIFEDKGMIILTIIGFIFGAGYQIWEEIRFS